MAEMSSDTGMTLNRYTGHMPDLTLIFYVIYKYTDSFSYNCFKKTVFGQIEAQASYKIKLYF
jgi:hypothetical protein